MELFVELIDDAEANSILSFFNETPTGARKKTATLDQKKVQIKKVFKSMTPNMKRKRRVGGANPFYAYINRYLKAVSSTGENFFDHVLLLRELEKELPRFVRFANLLLNFPEETRKNIEDFSELLQQEKDIFTLGNEGFKTAADLNDFLRKYGVFIGEEAPLKIVQLILENQPSDFTEKLQECKKLTKNMDSLEFYNNKEAFFEKYGVPIADIAYVLTHPEEDQDILKLLAIEALTETFKLQNEKISKEVKDKIKEIEVDLKDMDGHIKTKDDEIATLKSDLNKTTKNINLLKEKIQSLTISNEEKEKQNEELQKELQLERERLKEIQKNEMKALHSNLEKKLQALRKERDALVETHRQEQTELQMKLEHAEKVYQKELEMKTLIENERISCFQSSQVQDLNWGIICVSGFEVISEIFPEIPMIRTEDDLPSLLKNDHIQSVYLFMNGLPTRRFRKIEKEIQKSNKTSIPMEFESSKEAIEWIGYIKTMERRGVKV